MILQGISKSVRWIFLVHQGWSSTTSILQPLDQGIIHAVKWHYRARVVQHMLCNIASGRDINVNILEAMQMFSAAWRALKEVQRSAQVKFLKF
jgi:hypothetical protein